MHEEYINYFRTMADNDKNLRYIYDQSRHRLTLFLVVSPSISWPDWQMQSDNLRKRCTMKRSTPIPDLWVVDPSAPGLEGMPETAIVYREDLNSFLPALNVAVWRKLAFTNALATARAAAGEATLYMARYGEIPTAKAIHYSGHIFTGEKHGDQAAAVHNVLSRINAR